MSDHPFPRLQTYPNSGLTFPWAEINPNVVGSGDARIGSDGSSSVMMIIINWEDLEQAVTELVGFSYRDTSNSTLDPTTGFWSPPPLLRRQIPWQHPYWNNTFVKGITAIKGVRNEGNSIINIEDFFTGIGGDIGGGFGAGAGVNYGPWSEFALALLTVAFWRPPYVMRSDDDVFDPNTNTQREWLRWVDRNWVLESEMLTREGGQFRWSNTSPGGTPNAWIPETSQGVITANSNFAGNVGQKVTHQKVKRTWYEVPERGIFLPLGGDSAPNGLPYNLSYTTTPTVNPITGYTYIASSPIVGCVNSPVGGGLDDTDQANWFYGCYAGTLLLNSIEITPRPLQLPGYLMNIPPFNSTDPGSPGERISQQQCDITFHFDRFDPPRSTKLTSGFYPPDSSTPQTQVRGHNLCPWSGDGFWYPVTSQSPVSGSFAGIPGTGQTISITVTNGGITGATISTPGSAFPPSTTYLFFVVQGAATGGLVSISTNAGGTLSGTPIIISGGSGYTSGSGVTISLAGSPSTIYQYADFTDLFLLV